MKAASLAILLSISFLVTPLAHAWGADGHRLVAQIAEANLTPKARQNVEALLAYEPGATMVSVATWADETRTPTTAPWHFVNFPRGDCNYQPPVECRDGRCLVAALARQEVILADREAPIEDREKALKYVIHLVGDAHQPLHAGFLDDKGGNRYQVNFEGRSSNLHKLWDSGLIRYFGITSPAYEQQMTALSHDPSYNDGDRNAVDWVEHSCRLAQAPWMYPPHKVPASYAPQVQAQLDTQLIVAGVHLADVLNSLLGSP